MGPGKRVACPFQSLQMPPSSRVCPPALQKEAQDRGQNKRPVLLLLEVWNMIQAQKTGMGLPAIRAGGIDKAYTVLSQTWASSNDYTPGLVVGKVLEPPCIESSGPSWTGRPPTLMPTQTHTLVLHTGGMPQKGAFRTEKWSTAIPL